MFEFPTMMDGLQRSGFESSGSADVQICVYTCVICHYRPVADVFLGIDA